MHEKEEVDYRLNNYNFFTKSSVNLNTSKLIRSLLKQTIAIKQL